MISEKEISEIKYPEQSSLADDELQEVDEHFFPGLIYQKKKEKSQKFLKNIIQNFPKKIRLFFYYQ